MRLIPLFEPRVLRGKYLGRVLKSRHLTTGPMCERLRAALAEYFKVDPSMVVLGSSATACFQVLCDHWSDLSLNTGPQSVVFNSVTFAGMRQAVCHANLPFRSLAEGPQKGDRVIHTDIGGWTKDTKGADLYDRCHSWIYRGENLALYSFYPTKLCGGAEGGALISRFKGLGEELQCRLNCGAAPLSAGPLRDLEPRYLGRKGGMTDVQAALNLEALQNVDSYKDEISERWGHMWGLLGERNILAQWKKVPYLLQIRVGSNDYKDIRARLLKKGVPTALNFPGNGLITLPAPRTREMRKTVVLALCEVLER